MSEETNKMIHEMRKRFNEEVSVTVVLSKEKLNLYKTLIFKEAEEVTVSKEAYAKHLKFLESLSEEELYPRLIKIAFEQELTNQCINNLNKLSNEKE